MEKDELKKNIALYYSKLPPRAQDFFAKMEWLVNLQKISEKYGLNDEQKETLGTETTLLLLGIIHPVEYEENLSREISLDSSSWEKIIKEIENSMLSDVRQQLVEAFNANKKSDAEQIENAEKGEEGETKPQPDIVQKLDARFDKLPENIQGVVEKSNYQTILYSIAQARKLSIPQMGILDSVTTDLMLGTIHSDQYKGVLLKKLGLTEADTTALVEEINEKVFKTIRGGMMKMSSSEKTKPEAIQPSKDDLATLKKHGIDIVSGTLEIEAPHPILQQKLSAPVQATSVKTDYTIKQKEVPKVTKYKPGEDPYRVVPE